MNNYLNLTDINNRLTVCIEIDPIGTPMVEVLVNNTVQYNSSLLKSEIINDYIPLLKPFEISIILSDKHYTDEYETAVIIKKLTIDNIELIPKYDYLASYTNDHDNTDPTSYLGFNGKWTLTIDRPFYQWLHQHSGQGWLLT